MFYFRFLGAKVIFSFKSAFSLIKPHAIRTFIRNSFLPPNQELSCLAALVISLA